MNDVKAVAALSEALGQLGVDSRILALAVAALVMRDHPHWAVWLPASDRDWTAIRPAGSRPPAPDLPMIWVNAATASELASLMRSVDEQVSSAGHVRK
jgi:hypothetical protein